MIGNDALTKNSDANIHLLNGEEFVRIIDSKKGYSEDLSGALNKSSILGLEFGELNLTE